MKDKMFFTVMEDGEEKQYKIIKVCKNNNIDYIIYTFDDSEIFASRFEIIDGELTLFNIENDSEWDFIDKELED